MVIAGLVIDALGFLIRGSLALLKIGAGVIKTLAQFPRQGAVVAVPLVGPPELTDPKPDDAPNAAQQHFFLPGKTSILDDVADLAIRDCKGRL